ncbi:Mu transposase C-terminal domain-containing protein [Blautia wexlerae]|uniref:Mu transposase C-terminal domain-containing protein n=1 Tax=Blautia wexlerae TaxID=418240 RepID=UPI00189F467F|nr:Mu transposase C-terminal domain-containing protein [Blautia wexlerae]
MQKNDVYKTGILKKDAEMLRVLKIKEGKALVVDCVKSRMPWWISQSDLNDAVEISEDDLLEETGTCLPEDVSAAANRVMHKRFHMIAGILPFVDDKKKRSYLIEEAVRTHEVSVNTVKNYLISYLTYQNIMVLAPKERMKEKELTQDEKNMRWALNKYYYTKAKQSISTAYTLMLKEKYCDGEGRLLENYPSIHQFRYFYRKNRKMQTYYISRNGLKDYQRNNRPLVGDGIQEEFAAVGVGMLDATICDIYLVDDSGHLVGRPILVACVDAYSSFCYGYSLLWEGGVYSLRNLMLNVIVDKEEWCRKFGILIDRKQWDSNCLPGVMVTDMGTEYTSGNFEQITELGISVTNLPAYRPELKGQVEKFFDLMQSEYKKHLKGKGVIEPDYQERGARDYRKDACLTIHDFETIILRCILYYNSQRIVGNFPYTKEMISDGVKPYAASIFEWGRKQPGADLIKVSKEKLIQVLLPRTEGRFSRYGLKVNGMRYHAEGYTEEYLKGGVVTVAYNPENVSRVWLLEDGTFQPFELIERRFDGKTLEDVEMLKAGCNEIIKNAASENLQARIDLAKHIQDISGRAGKSEDTKIKNVRTTRRKEQRKRHMDFVKEDAGNE